MKKFLIYIMVLVGSISCQNNEIIEIVPSVVTLENQTFQIGGVALSADFQNFEENHNLGISLLSDTKTREYIFENPTRGKNTLSINAGLIVDKIYKYTGFIDTPNGRIKGLTKEFYSLGSLNPKLKSIAPDKGFVGELIEIEFEEELTDIKASDFIIKFENLEAQIINIVANKKVIVRVPNKLDDVNTFYKNSSLEINYLGKQIPNSYNFELQGPTVTSVSPSKIDYGGELIIKGHFYKNDYPTRIYVSTALRAAEIISHSSREIRLRVHAMVYTKNPEIIVVSNSLRTVIKNSFDFNPPEVFLFPDVVKVSEDFEIVGKNFIRYGEYQSRVFIDGIEVLEKVIFGDKITFSIPEKNYPNNKAILTVSSRDDLFSPEYELTVSNLSTK